MPPDRNKAARELLSFYVEAGVDAAIDEQPHDFLSAPEAPAPAERPSRAAADAGSGASSAAQNRPARTVAVTLRMTPRQHDALRRVAYETRTSINRLMMDGLAEVLRSRGYRPADTRLLDEEKAVQLVTWIPT